MPLILTTAEKTNPLFQACFHGNYPTNTTQKKKRHQYRLDKTVPWHSSPMLSDPTRALMIFYSIYYSIDTQNVKKFLNRKTIYIYIRHPAEPCAAFGGRGSNPTYITKNFSPHTKWDAENFMVRPEGWPDRETGPLRQGKKNPFIKPASPPGACARR